MVIMSAWISVKRVVKCGAQALVRCCLLVVQAHV